MKSLFYVYVQKAKESVKEAFYSLRKFTSSVALLMPVLLFDLFIFCCVQKL